MSIDFKALVNNRPALRPVADLRQAPTSHVWDSWTPNTADKSIKAALTKVKNAPVSDNWWENLKTDLFNALQHPVTQGVLNTLDAPRNAAFKMVDNWTDGKLDWGDVPIVGLAQGVAGSYSPEGKVTTEDFLNKFGIQGEEGKLDWTDVAGFVGDVALDPTTYLTFGAGGVAKAAASKAAQQAGKEALEAGLKMGLQAGSKELDDFVAEATTKAAKAKANNQLVGFSVPFGKEYTILEKPDFLKVKSQTVGTKPAADLAAKMAMLGMSNQERYNLASKIFGRPVNSFKELNTQEWDYLNKMADSPDFIDNWKQIQQATPDPFASSVEDFSKMSKADLRSTLRSASQGVTNVDLRADIALALSRKKTTKQQLIDFLNKLEPNTNTVKSTIDDSQQMFDDLAQKFGSGYRYFEGADGMSDLGKLLKNNKLVDSIGTTLGKYFGGRRFVPASVQLADHRVKQGVETLEDARLGGYAKARFKIDDMAKLAKDPAIKDLTPEELNILPYVIEGKWPESIKPEQIAPETMQKLEAAASKLKEYRDQFTKEELEAGVQYTPRDNYFPHILNIPKSGTEEFQAFLTKLRSADPELALRLENAPRGFTRERKLFDSMAELRDYLDRNANNEEIQKLFGNAVFNPVEAYARRAMSGAQEVAKMQGYKELQRLGVAQKLPPKGKIPRGWERIDVPGLKDHIVPEEVAKSMSQLTKILTNDASLNKLLNRAEQIYTIWRRNATVLSPGFHLRQMIGNIFQNALAGVTPKAYMDAVKVLSGKGTVKIGGQNLPAEAIIKMAMEDGVIGTGSSADFLTDLTKELGSRLGGFDKQRLNPLSDRFAPGQWGRKANERVDNFSRMAHYIYVLQKGGTRKIARESVIKHLFDYSNLSGFERGVMRTVFPFYNWMRNNIPFQIAQMVKRPGLYQVIDDLQSDLQQEPEVDPLLDQMGINNQQDRELMRRLVEENGGVLPDYIRERYINVGGNNYFNLGLPSSDLSDLGHPVDTIKQSSNPMLQFLTGWWSNRNAFGAPIDKNHEDLSLFSPEGLRFILDQFGGFPGRTIGNYIPDSEGQARADNLTLMEELGKMLGVTQVDPIKQLESILFQRAREVR